MEGQRTSELRHCSLVLGRTCPKNYVGNRHTHNYVPSILLPADERSAFLERALYQQFFTAGLSSFELDFNYGNFPDISAKNAIL